jgi:NAD(P)H-quinone oxidoreductase subunit 4L
MSSKSNFFAVVYGVVAAVVILLFATGQFDPIMTGIGVSPERADLFATLIVVAVGLVCLIFGGHGTALMAIGTVAAFIALTLHQDILIKYLTLAAVLFGIGAYGMVASRNAVRVLMSIELMINAVNINLIAFARYIDPTFVRGQVFAIFILTVAAAEAAVGLAIVLAIYRNSQTVDMERFNLLKW